MPDDESNDPGLALRRQAAERLKNLVEKQIQLSTSLVTVFTQHTSASIGLIAKMAETGDLHLKQWIGNAFALSVETWGAAYDACAAPAGEAAPIAQSTVPGQTSFTLTADDVAEVAGPVVLEIPAAQLPALAVTPLVDSNGQPAAPAALNLTTRDGFVVVEIRDLRANDTPLPAGTYTGTVTQTQGSVTTTVATITLTRT